MTVLVNERQGTGSYRVEFDAGGFTDGIYIARFEAQGENGNFQQSLRMVLMK